MTDTTETPQNQPADIITSGGSGTVGKKSLKLAILVASLGMVLFIVVTVTFSFKEPIFTALFPKPASFAAAIPSPTPHAPTPTPAASPSAQAAGTKRIFISSTLYDGNLGGLTGADQKCQQTADAAKIRGTWKAWLSDSKTGASDRLSHSKGSYTLMDGSTAADSWDDLTDGVLKSPLELNEATQSASWSVWTDTNPSGNLASPNSCQDWTSNNSADLGRVGSSSFSDLRWSSYSSSSCNFTRRLYCIEQ